MPSVGHERFDICNEVRKGGAEKYFFTIVGVFIYVTTNFSKVYSGSVFNLKRKLMPGFVMRQ